MKILSFGAGTQSTALALMSCENALAIRDHRDPPHKLVPVYDAVIIVDLGPATSWEKIQLEFVREACKKSGIFFHVIKKDLYKDLVDNYGRKRTVAIPWWTRMPDGRTGKIGRRACTGDYKIDAVAKYVRWELLGYKKGQRTRPEDIKAHEMHIGFSAEEKKRCNLNPNKLFVNRYPLIEMDLSRKDNYQYTLDVWGLDTKASSCLFCPFHQNYFFKYLKENEPDGYQAVLKIDHILRDRKPYYPMAAEMFISRSWKRIEDLTPEDCNDRTCFAYCGRYSGTPIQVWDGF